MTDLFELFFGKKSPKAAPSAEEQQAQLESLGIDPVKARELQQLVAKEKARPPRIAVIGKAGVGKTSTINSLFNATWRTSHSVAGTTGPQEKEFELAGGGSLTIVDMPGLGEDIDADLQYERYYAEVLPKADVALLVMQANAKDLAEDQRILQTVVLPAMKGIEGRLVVGLNQVDKIGPGAWNDRLNYPSAEQQQSIERRCRDIAAKLSRVTAVKAEQIVYYSAVRRYRLYDLLIATIRGADQLGWKMPIQPADPTDQMDPEVREYVLAEKARRAAARGKQKPNQQ